MTDAKMRSCRVCKTETTNFDKWARTCRDCRDKDLSRCTKCGIAKPKSAFYKGNVYGLCAACKTGNEPDYMPRVAGFAGLDPEVQQGIIQMLCERRLWDATGGKQGHKHRKRDISRKYNVNESSLCLWIQKGTIPMPELNLPDLNKDNNEE